MKRIIPFKKEIFFKTNISEITSISLEHNLSIDNQDIKGEFIVNGDYKISDRSKMVETFDYKIPFEISIDDIYDISNALVDIDDFYYEIINNQILSVSIDVCVDKIKERLIINEIPNLEEKKDIIEELYEEQKKEDNLSIEENDINIEKKINQENRCIEKGDIIPGKEEFDNMENKKEIIEKNESKNKDIVDNNESNKEEITDKINSLFSNVGDSNNYVAYNVYIIREGDTIDGIIEKYETTEDE